MKAETTDPALEAERRLRMKALEALREGRVRVFVVERNWDREFAEWRPSLRILGRVASSVAGKPPAEVRYVEGVWSCTCWADPQTGFCKHTVAVAMVTGHPQPGAKVVRAES